MSFIFLVIAFISSKRGTWALLITLSKSLAVRVNVGVSWLGVAPPAVPFLSVPPLLQ